MWLIVPFILILVFMVIAGALAGGIYTAILIPIVVIVLVAVSALAMIRRRREPGRPPAHAGTAGWPPSVGSGATGGRTTPEPSGPEDLVRERQREQ